MSNVPHGFGSGIPGGFQVPFNKPWQSCADQLNRLESRGLVVADRAAAEAFLSHVNYYRFSGYVLAFEQTRHSLVPGTTFGQVQGAYEFDRVLRNLVTEALEVVEVDARTAIAYHFGMQYGAFGHTDASNFFRPPPSQHATKPREFKHVNWMDSVTREANRSKERFVEHYKSTYLDFPKLPVWMVTEVMSFGSLSRMYQGMLATDQRAVAKRYGVQPRFLESWLHHLVYVRNVCAHHSRLWDRGWAIKPDLPPLEAWLPPLMPGNDHTYVSLVILRRLLGRCSAIAPFDVDWKHRVEVHLAHPPEAPNALGRMGLAPNWDSNPLWA